MDRVFHIGVIGAGGRGGLANYAHRPEQGFELSACADTSARERDNFLGRFPQARAYGDYRELLEKETLDAVFIATPDWLHEEQAVAALEAGCAVYLEKPMAITIEGCTRILETAARTSSKLYVGHNMRHFPVIRKMRECIQAVMVGEVKSAWCRHFVSYGGDAYFKDWHADRTRSTGLLLQKGAHDIDVLHWLCGGYTRKVSAFGKLGVYGAISDRHPDSERGDASFHEENWPPSTQRQLNPVVDVEDLNLMLMELDNGVLASYQQCHYTPDAWRNYTVIGDAGRIENFGDTAGNATVRVWNRRRDVYGPADEEFVIPAEEGTHGGADPRIVDEFLRYLRTGCEVETSPVAAWHSIATGCMATESVRAGGVLKEVPALPISVKL